jgi:hypothetical protein
MELISCKEEVQPAGTIAPELVGDESFVAIYEGLEGHPTDTYADTFAAAMELFLREGL